MIQCNRCNLQYIGETKDVWKHRRTVDISNNTSTILDKIVETLNYKLTAPPPPTPIQCCLRILIIEQHCNGGGGEVVGQCTLTPTVPTNFVQDCL